MENKCYIISYDLKKTKDYSNLIAAIKAYGTWAHILESVWAVVTTQTAVQVRDNLLQHMDEDDGLIVVLSANVGAWRNVDCANEWLKKSL